MKTVRSLFHRLYNLFHKEQLDRDLSDELAAHLEMHTADNVREGLGVGRSAAWGADTALGGVEQTKESMRDRRSVPLLHWHGAGGGTHTDPAFGDCSRPEAYAHWHGAWDTRRPCFGAIHAQPALWRQRN